MTLGRTSSGAIKIKTDGGLRAVNCACCGGCECGIIIPQELRELVANATISTVTMYGYYPQYFDIDLYGPNTWRAYWTEEDPSGTSELYDAEIRYDITTGCLSRVYPMTWIPQPPVYGPTGGIIQGIGSIGTPEGCGEVEPFVTATFTINGAGGYPYYYLTGFDYTSGANYGVVPPPNLVFS